MKRNSHPDIINRLRRAEGHLKSVLKMLEDDKGCLEIAQQLHAVEAAMANAKKELIHDHIEHCLDDGHTEDSKSAMRELKQISKYL